MFENTPHTDRPDNESTGKAALHKAAERVREGVKAAYPHAHFRHLSWAVLLAFVFFISTDSIEAVFSSRFFTNVYWWCVYVFFFGGCYFFCSPYLRNTLYTQALYINFHRGYVLVFVSLRIFCGMYFLMLAYSVSALHYYMPLFPFLPGILVLFFVMALNDNVNVQQIRSY